MPGVEGRPVVEHAHHRAPVFGREPDGDLAATLLAKRREAVVDEVLQDGANVGRVPVGLHRLGALEPHDQPVLRGEPRDVVGQRAEHAVEGDALKLGLARGFASSGAPAGERGPGRPGRGPAQEIAGRGLLVRASGGLCWPRGSVALPGRFARHALHQRELVEEQDQRVQGVVELVEHRRRQHPHRLVALHLLQSRAKGLGTARRVFRRREASAQAQVVRADAEQSPDQHREDVIGRAACARANGPVSVPLWIRASAQHVEDAT